MQKPLLIAALAAFALTASAQKRLPKLQTNLKTVEAVGLKATGNLATGIRKAPRLTTENPTASYNRGGGIWWLGFNYRASAAGAYGLAAPGVNIIFAANVTGESSKWSYVSGLNEAQDGYAYAEKDVTTKDSTLSMNLTNLYVPAPALYSTSSVGTSRLNAKEVTDTAASLFEGIQFGGGTYGYFSDTDETTGETVNYNFPICNYNLNEYAGTGAASDYLGVNSPAANEALGNAYSAYGVSNLTIKSAAEYFVNDTASTMYVTGGDAWLYADNAPTSDSIVAEILSDDDLSVIGTLNIDDVSTITSQSGTVMAYGVHFTASSPIETKGNVIFNIRAAEGTSYTFTPRIVVTTDDGDGTYGYVIVDYTYATEEGDVDYENDFLDVDMFNWNDATLHSASWAMGLTVNFDKEAAEAETGITTVKQTRTDGAIYDLQGRRVAKAEKGIFIINGKKVVK